MGDQGVPFDHQVQQFEDSHAKGSAGNWGFQPPLAQLIPGEWGFTAMAVNRAVSSHFGVNQRALRNVRSRWHCLGPDGHRHGAALPDDRRPLAGGRVQGCRGSIPSARRRGGQVLPGARRRGPAAAVALGQVCDHSAKGKPRPRLTQLPAGTYHAFLPSKWYTTWNPWVRDT